MGNVISKENIGALLILGFCLFIVLFTLFPIDRLVIKRLRIKKDFNYSYTLLIAFTLALLCYFSGLAFLLYLLVVLPIFLVILVLFTIELQYLRSILIIGFLLIGVMLALNILNGIQYIIAPLSLLLFTVLLRIIYGKKTN